MHNFKIIDLIDSINEEVINLTLFFGFYHINVIPSNSGKIPLTSDYSEWLNWDPNIGYSNPDGVALELGLTVPNLPYQ